MKLYIKICILSATVMFCLIGGYSILFSENREEAIMTNADADADVKEIIELERKRFVANACDAVCGGAPYLCKVAFCSIVLNRCNDNSFPNTAAEVIFFDPEFNIGLEYDYSRNPSQSSLEAFDDANNGFSPCPEALFYTTTESSNIVLKRRLTLFQIGKYIFS